MESKAFYSTLVDYHMHTPLCLHAEGEPTEYAKRAVALGLKEIGFSEHCPMPSYFDRLRMKEEDFPHYVERVQTARKAFPELTIRFGIEAEYASGEEDYVRRFLDCADWDYVLGSVHYIREWNFDAPEAVARWKEFRDLYGQWKLYFELWKAAARSKLYDSLAHPDLVKKFGFVPAETCDDLFKDALSVVAELNLTIEINTAGLRKPVKEIYPSSRFLEIAKSFDIPISLGSDAHAPHEVGMNFKEAVELAKNSGYTHYARFAQRKRTLHPLP
jgi:histidinol-phosphatase (PHP family)